MTEKHIAKSLIRDYAYEHQLRTKKKKRFVADIEKEKALIFEALLKSKDITFSTWIKNQIEIEIQKND